MRYAVGVDVGSTQTKAVLVDEKGQIVARSLIDTGAYLVRAAERSLEACLAEAGVSRSDVGYAVGTGYGRFKVAFGDDQVTEISCHAKGAWFLFPKTRTVIDIGGQDTKAIKVSDRGEVLDFAMNDKCAAGTGRFLEVILGRLQVPLEGLAERVAAAPRAVPVSSTCTVFAESEVISLVASGEPLEGIVKGLHSALAARVAALARVTATADVWMSGGVALNGAMVAALRDALGRPVRVLPDPQLVGALGAALSVAPAR